MSGYFVSFISNLVHEPNNLLVKVSIPDSITMIQYFFHLDNHSSYLLGLIRTCLTYSTLRFRDSGIRVDSWTLIVIIFMLFSLSHTHTHWYMCSRKCIPSSVSKTSSPSSLIRICCLIFFVIVPQLILTFTFRTISGAASQEISYSVVSGIWPILLFYYPPFI